MKTGGRLWRLAIMGTVVLGVAALAIWRFNDASSVTVGISNVSGRKIAMVTIEAAGTKVWQGSLDQSQRKAIQFHAETDGTIRLTRSDDDAAVTDFGYITPNIGANFDVSLLAGGVTQTRVE